VRGVIEALRRHWPEYLIEAAGLGLFMVSAGAFATLIHHPGSPVRGAVPDPLARRALMGIAMGLTAIAIIYSPWGKRSGAHINPAVTLTFWRLGKIEGRDAAFYVLAQFAGGAAGMAAVAAILAGPIADPSVRYVATLPGPLGAGAAFAAEAAISCGLMLAVLTLGNAPRVARFTGLAAGTLVAIYITFEDPLSGMSMNPARSFASASVGGVWTSYWVYLTAPALGMLAASRIYAGLRGRSRVLCAKLHHDNDQRCIFRCGYPRCGGRARPLRGAEAA
jgi:aquaporin Z